MQDISRYPFLTRRGFLIAGAATLPALKLAAAAETCGLTPEQEEGPYYVNDRTLRTNVTENRPGVPLDLRISVVDARTCAPLPNAAVDIWHCDASGLYSGFTASSPDGGPGGRGPGRRGGPRDFGPGGPPPFDGPGGPGGFGGPPPANFRPGARELDPTRFLRGVQLSDSKGQVGFSTVYPGWYSGRAIHIHMKVHIGGAAAASYSGGHVAHTGQLFFPEDLTERIAKIEPYVKRLQIHRTTQEEDMVYNSQHGASVMLRMERLHREDRDGYRAAATLAVNPEATPALVGVGGRGRG